MSLCKDVGLETKCELRAYHLSQRWFKRSRTRRERNMVKQMAIKQLQEFNAPELDTTEYDRFKGIELQEIPSGIEFEIVKEPGMDYDDDGQEVIVECHRVWR